MKAWTEERAKEVVRRAFEKELAKQQKSWEIVEKWNHELAKILTPEEWLNIKFKLKKGKTWYYLNKQEMTQFEE